MSVELPRRAYAMTLLIADLDALSPLTTVAPRCAQLCAAVVNANRSTMNIEPQKPIGNRIFEATKKMSSSGNKVGREEL
jgi:hypothetical protein